MGVRAKFDYLIDAEKKGVYAKISLDEKPCLSPLTDIVNTPVVQMSRAHPLLNGKVIGEVRDAKILEEMGYPKMSLPFEDLPQNVHLKEELPVPVCTCVEAFFEKLDI